MRGRSGLLDSFVRLTALLVLFGVCTGYSTQAQAHYDGNADKPRHLYRLWANYQWRWGPSPVEVHQWAIANVWGEAFQHISCEAVLPAAPIPEWKCFYSMNGATAPYYYDIVYEVHCPYPQEWGGTVGQTTDLAVIPEGMCVTASHECVAKEHAIHSFETVGGTQPLYRNLPKVKGDQNAAICVAERIAPVAEHPTKAGCFEVSYQFKGGAEHDKVGGEDVTTGEPEGNTEDCGTGNITDPTPGGGGGGDPPGGGGGSASGGLTCESAPVCSGDPIHCAILEQVWRVRCGPQAGSSSSASVSGGQSCDAAPVCEGDPVQCGLIEQQWRQRCADVPADSEALSAAGFGDYDPDNPLGATPETDVSSMVSAGDGWLSNRSCMASPTVNLASQGIGSVTLDLSYLCPLWELLSLLLVAASWLSAARIVVGGF